MRVLSGGSKGIPGEHWKPSSSRVRLSVNSGGEGGCSLVLQSKTALRHYSPFGLCRMSGLSKYSRRTRCVLVGLSSRRCACDRKRPPVAEEILSANRADRVKFDALTLMLRWRGAERVGFEPTVPGGTSDFESDTIDHSDTSPRSKNYIITFLSESPRLKST